MTIGELFKDYSRQRAVTAKKLPKPTPIASEFNDLIVPLHCEQNGNSALDELKFVAKTLTPDKLLTQLP